jgi:hypothetical protein
MKQELIQEQEEVVYFNIQELLPIGMTFIVLGIGLAYGLSVMGDVRDDMTTSSHEYNATASAITAVKKIPDKLGLIVTVVLAVVIIGLLIRYLMVRF